MTVWLIIDVIALDDVILYNEAREVTETTIGNIAVRFKNDSAWYTPPISCGVLPGCMRQHLLEKAELKERTITLDELTLVEELKLLNSVRGTWIGVLEFNRD